MLQRLVSLLLWLQLVCALPSGLDPQAKQNAVVAKTLNSRMVVMSDSHHSQHSNSLHPTILPIRERRQAPGGGKGAKGKGKRGGGDSATGPTSAAPNTGGPKGGGAPIAGLENLDSLAEDIGHTIGKSIGQQIGSSILGDTLGGKVGTSIGNLIGGKIGKGIGGQLNDFLSNGGLDSLLNKALGGLTGGAKLIELES